MIEPPERDAARDSALDALLPLVPARGWTVAALREAAGPDADLLFPGGATDMVEAWCDLADRRMEAAAQSLPLETLRVHERVRALVALRLRQSEPNREAVRRAMSLLALPGHGRAAAACTARTVDAIWHAAGDRAADVSWYTKRAILVAVYGATLLFWLRHEDETEVLAFLDRRLAGVARIGRLRRRLRPGRAPL